MKVKICELDEMKVCNDCRKCDYCDLNPEKICDNCCECLDEADYRAVKILEIITNEEQAKKYRK